MPSVQTGSLHPPPLRTHPAGVAPFPAPGPALSCWGAPHSQCPQLCEGPHCSGPRFVPSCLPPLLVFATLCPASTQRAPTRPSGPLSNIPFSGKPPLAGATPPLGPQPREGDSDYSLACTSSPQSCFLTTVRCLSTCDSSIVHVFKRLQKLPGATPSALRRFTPQRC